MMESRTALTIAAGVAGTLFLGYCVYFDKKRRQDPDFKRKLRDRRSAKLNASAGGRPLGPLPDLTDHEAVQRFFLQQVQLGEELLAAGNLEAGVEHLGVGVAICGQTPQLLSVLQQTLPAPIFRLLLERLPIVSARLQASIKASKPAPATVTLQEEDVE